jgi:CheY-like chemotaxis protein
LMANLSFAEEDVAKLAHNALARAGNGSGGDGALLDWVASQLREIAEPLREAREAADRVRLIVRDLKMFSRSDEESMGAADVRRVIESSLRMAWNEIRHRARLVKDYGDVPAVAGNEARLGQVFLNLIINAAQAVPEGRADQNEIRLVTKQDSRGRVIVEVRDTGAGIPEAVRSRLFEPFFTTKPIGVGTGLGLAICHRIVTSMGGEIEVESEIGKGTVFRLILPAATADSAEAPVPAPVVAAGRRARILVIDDELALASSVRRMLSSEHEVLAITSARDAIERIASGERFDVILCDLMMPEVTGMDLHAELSRLAPDQAEQVIFMTGGAFTSRARTFLDQVGNPRIEKPFDVHSIRALVRGMLR